MLVQLVKEFDVKPSVAALALLATGFKSRDAALNYVSDQFADTEKMQHPFVGCFAYESANQNAESNATVLKDDLEA